MPIIRCSEQKSRTLEKFYNDAKASDESTISGIGKVMLLIIDEINKTFTTTKIYGLTSHYRLFLLSADNGRTPWFVSIIALNSKNIYIEYLLPENKQPWADARVRGEASSIQEAMKYLIIAMTESQGWINNEELAALYQQIHAAQ